MLFTEHVYAFEIAAVILLVAIIAAIALTMRKRPETKYAESVDGRCAVKASRPACASSRWTRRRRPDDCPV